MAYRLVSKATTLGMSLGTARARLLRSIIWSLLGDLGRTDCLRCGHPMTFETYSIDHVEPWQGESANRYFDVANVGFSHLTCNSEARRIPRGFAAAHRKTAPEGQGWCSLHKGYAPLSDFGKHAVTYDGRRHQCKPCRSRTRSRKNMVGLAQ